MLIYTSLKIGSLELRWFSINLPSKDGYGWINLPPRRYLSQYPQSITAVNLKAGFPGFLRFPGTVGRGPGTVGALNVGPWGIFSPLLLVVLYWNFCNIRHIRWSIIMVRLFPKQDKVPKNARCSLCLCPRFRCKTTALKHASRCISLT